MHFSDYIIPSDNWEQQHGFLKVCGKGIISYQAITGNNNIKNRHDTKRAIISYQAITGNNNQQEQIASQIALYHTKR